MSCQNLTTKSLTFLYHKDIFHIKKSFIRIYLENKNLITEVLVAHYTWPTEALPNLRYAYSVHGLMASCLDHLCHKSSSVTSPKGLAKSEGACSS